MSLKEFAARVRSADEKELRELLLTVDGKGVSIKEIALEELLRRAHNDGVNLGWEEAEAKS